MTSKMEPRDSQDLLEALMTNTTDYVYFKDAEGRFLQISKAMAEAFGLKDPSEAVGKTDYDFFSKESADVFLANEQEILRTGRPVVGVEQKEIRPDGRETWASTTKLCRTDAHGTTLGTLGISRDITARKLAEQELLKATDRLALAALAGGVGIWDYDPVRNELTWDDQMFALYGIGRDKFGSAHMARHAGLHPEDRSRVDEEIWLALRGDQEFDTEFRVVWPDGTIHDIRAMAIVQRDPSGRALHMVGTHWDITAQKEAERELRETNVKLADAMRRAIDLAVEADAANMAKSQFLANMSHEIRTPMNGVIGMMGLLLDTELDEEQRRYAETVRTSGESLLALLNDILDFSRIEAGKMELETLDFDLGDLLDNLTTLLAARAREAAIELSCAAAPDVPGLLCGDPGRLRQVLLNLASNALKFTHQGEVAIRVSTESETDAEVMLRFSVKDTGIGIPADRQGFLFQKFTQADASTTRRYGGTGLGLAISKQLAEMMGGKIGLVSEEGRGSEFWFTARFGKQAIRERGAAAPAGPVKSGSSYRLSHDARRGTFRILLAEDNMTNRQVALGILGKLGYRADAVANGAEVIRSLETFPYDLVLMDVQMPEMDGMEATRQIRDPRSAALRHEIPIIAMTAHALQGDRERCLEAGMDDYVVKPVSPQALAEAMDRWLPGLSDAEAEPPSVGSEAAGSRAGAAARADAAGVPVFDRAGMLARLMGDEELARIVVGGFFTDIPLQLEALNGYLHGGDEAGALRQLHSIKGASAQLGGEALRAVAIEMETAGKDGDLGAISARMPDLASQVAQLREAMRDFATSRGPGPRDLP
jgi:PAS domain S-box-containing protein